MKLSTVIKSHYSAIILIVLNVLIVQSAFAQLPDFTQLVKQHAAAVVNVSTTQKIPDPVASGDEQLQLPEGAPLDEFFRRFFGGPGGKAPAPRRNAKSLGSGFIISDDGYMITNHHVVKDADTIIVRLQDRRELEAEVIGSDKRSDIALLKIDADDLPTVKIGSSSDLEVGEWVVAIGSPFGFDHSVTAGIVSAKGRSLPSDSYVPFIQTDVAINPGNSGGPLFNMNGEVVGVNSQIYSRTGGFMGLSFSVPMDVAMKVVEQLKSTGHVKRGWLGVQIQDVSRELAESFGMDKPEGALVSKVIKNSPAQKSGLQVGDVIIEYNGKNVPTSSTLPAMVGVTSIGKSIPVTVIRQGRKQSLTVKIGELTDDIAEASLQDLDDSVVKVDRMGITVSEVPEDMRTQLQIPDGGAMINQVKSGPAADSGLRRGDVILQIQYKDVEGPKQLKKLINAVDTDRPVAILVQRGNHPLYLAIKLND
ncbi:MAG TPA: DegQ family serine endoprotease [Crenotrichaceae bacterium]|nr:DegQ family serine endoprotease [Crenotrichaceae bacterium]